MYFHGQRKTHRTHRWMQTEHWAQFDAKMEGLLGQNTFQNARAKGELIEKHFKLNGGIMVRVKNSHTPTEVLSNCLGCSEDNHGLALDCFIGIRNDGKWEYEKNSSSNQTEYVPTAALSSTTSTPSTSVSYTPSPKKETHTYTASASKSDLIVKKKSVNVTLPCSVVPQASKDLEDECVEPYSPKPSGTLSYPSYSATAESSAAVFDTVEPYSPKPLREQCAESPGVPQYYPIRIQKEQELVNNGGKEPTPQTDCDKTKKKEKLSRKREHSKQTDNVSITPVMVDNILSGREKRKGLEKPERINSETKVKSKVRTVQVSSNNETNMLYSTQLKNEWKPTALRNYKETASTELRRSMRAIVPATDCTDKKLLKKYTALDKNLFGSDDDDAEISDPCFDQLLVAPIGYGSKTKCRRSPKSDAGEKEQQMTSKGAPSEMNTNGIIHDDITTTTIITKKYRAKRMQIGKEMEKNLNLNIAVKKCFGTAPDEVQIFSLDNMSSSAIVKTFMDHKITLDAVFQAVKRKKDIRSYNGVNHFLVMELTTESNQLDMMNHLENIYRPDFEGGSLSLTAMLINALLPEWIVGIFMHKFKMTRKETIQQLKAQEHFKLHMAAESNNTLRLD